MADQQIQAEVQVTPQLSAAEAAIAAADKRLTALQGKFDAVERAVAKLVRQPYTIRMRVDTAGVTNDLRRVKGQINDITGRVHRIRFDVESGTRLATGRAPSVRTAGTGNLSAADVAGYAEDDDGGPSSVARARGLRPGSASSRLSAMDRARGRVRAQAQRLDARAERNAPASAENTFFLAQGENQRLDRIRQREATRQRVAGQRINRQLKRNEVNDLAGLVDEASTMGPLMAGIGSREEEVLLGKIVRGTTGGGGRRGGGRSGGVTPFGMSGGGRYGGPLRFVPGIGALAADLSFAGAAAGALGVFGAVGGAMSAVSTGDQLRRMQEQMAFTLDARGLGGGQQLFDATTQLAISRAGVVDRTSLYADANRLAMVQGPAGQHLAPADVTRVLAAATSLGVGTARGTSATNAFSAFSAEAIERGSVDFRMLRALEGETGIDAFSMLAKARGQSPAEVRAMANEDRLAGVKTVRDLTIGIEKTFPDDKVKKLTDESLPLMAERVKAAFDVRVVGEFGRGISNGALPAAQQLAAALGGDSQDMRELGSLARTLGRELGAAAGQASVLGGYLAQAWGIVKQIAPFMPHIGVWGPIQDQLDAEETANTRGAAIAAGRNEADYGPSGVPPDSRSFLERARDAVTGFFSPSTASADDGSRDRNRGGGGPPGGGGAGGGGFGGAPITQAQSTGNVALARQMQAAGYGDQAIYEACGPIAVAALAQQNGVNASVGDIAKAAQAAGEFDPSRGVTNESAFVPNALKRLGLTGVKMDQQAALTRMSNGRATAISTPGHYFVGQGYDPSTGQVDTGNSGPAYASHGGQRYMTLEQIRQSGGGIQDFFGVAGGSPNGAIPLGSNNPELRAEARRQAIANGIDPLIFERQIERESHFNPQAVSGAGAKGIAQFTDDTAAGMGLKDPFDPRSSLAAAAKYDASIKNANGGDYEAMLRGYNAGPGRIAASRTFGETNQYVHDILGTGQGGGGGGGGGVTVHQQITVIGQMTEAQKHDLARQLRDPIADHLASGLETVGATAPGPR